MVHDYHCKVRTAPSEEVHEMFYHALLANGVDSNIAGLMYYAVRWFGPSWQLLKKISATEKFESFAVIGNSKVDLLSNKIIDEIAAASGQPSPNASRISRDARFSPRSADDYTARAWLMKDGTEVTQPGEIALPEAFEKAQKKFLSERFGQAEDVIRVSNLGGVSSEPTKSEVDQIKAWIESEHPNLDKLRTTPPRRVPK